MCNADEVTHALLLEGLDDWVPLAAVIATTGESRGEDGPPLDLAMAAVLKALILPGLMLPGDLAEQGFEPWPGEGAALIDRVISQCEQWGWDPRGSGCWFDLTPAGERQAAPRLRTEGH